MPNFFKRPKTFWPGLSENGFKIKSQSYTIFRFLKLFLFHILPKSPCLYFLLKLCFILEGFITATIVYANVWHALWVYLWGKVRKSVFICYLRRLVLFYSELPLEKIVLQFSKRSWFWLLSPYLNWLAQVRTKWDAWIGHTIYSKIQMQTIVFHKGASSLVISVQ